MEKYNTRIVDEVGRITIPADLRKDWDLETGSDISLTRVSALVVLQRSDGDKGITCRVDDLGRIDLPVQICNQMGWKEKAHIALYYTGNEIILKSA